MINVGLIGYGTVGKGVYERIVQTKELEALLGDSVVIKTILVKDRQKTRANHEEVVVTTEWDEFSQVADFDVIFEAIGGIEPAFSYTSFFLEKGIPVITANKKLVAEKGHVLESLAKLNQTYYGYEAAVAGGIPIINSLKGVLASTSISRISGILNGTTNYILTEMIDYNRSFADVLLEAQQLGYAETDPTDDLDGYDAWYKIRILSRLCFGKWPKEDDLKREGISRVEDWHVELGEKFGFKLKLIGEAWNSGTEVIGGVAPAFLTSTEPLVNVRGVTNGISIEGAAIDQLLFIGPGAGKEATANSMVEDFLFYKRSKQYERATVTKAVEHNPYSHVLVCIPHAEREQALQWVKKTGRHVIDTFAHHEGEGWIISDDFQETTPFIQYPIYGDVSLRKRAKSLHSAQFGSF
ncbi:homoserine dehydrogenase [Bacillus suaedae]|uniref:Homoserine dehydrogenase n=1 Tax=Halalkalibacter suaedae TaxID=2822140 RepID=A0A940WVJ1_9BACI|nr:homoserine dehydrogenase [Bacillus suaedae]MBP3951392.1 homoserine dehydrogenase [Bacillus suaedae]